LLNENKGKLDVELAKQMLGDHFDSFPEKKRRRTSARFAATWTLLRAGVCDLGLGNQLSRRRGAGQGQRFDDGRSNFASLPAWAIPAAKRFKPSRFLAAHPDYAWQEPYLRGHARGPVDRIPCWRNSSSSALTFSYNEKFS